MFQYTAARRRLDCCCRWYGFGGYCFNTQPPEGGWPKPNSCLAFVQRFQHTAARRRLVPNRPFPAKRRAVSTHSRPKAAGLAESPIRSLRAVSTHSRPKAAGVRNRGHTATGTVSTHSRPKAAGGIIRIHRTNPRSFNTQPPEGGWVRYEQTITRKLLFQHTAARRRLASRLTRRGRATTFQHTAARRRLDDV